MKAMRIHQYGGPEVMQAEEMEKPRPAPDEILVKLYASGINPVDWFIRQGAVEPLKAMMPLPLILGWDAAGVVEEVGSSVTSFKKGDAVYGVPNFPGAGGSYAAYCAAKAVQFAIKPTSIGFTEAAAVPLAALTGWTGMFAHGKLRAGQRILIQGASGSVGSLAVQFAKAKGAYVIGTASTANVDYVKSLGADEVIDYKTQPFEDLVKDVDVVLEASLVRDNKERVKAVGVLKEGGVFVTVNTDFAFDDEFTQALAAKNVKGEMAPNQPNGEWLKEIAQLIDAGKVQVLVSKTFPLEEVGQAHREGERGHGRGKLVLEIRKENAPA